MHIKQWHAWTVSVLKEIHKFIIYEYYLTAHVAKKFQQTWQTTEHLYVTALSAADNSSIDA